MFNKVSAVTGDGVEELLESLLLVAEVEDYRADPEGRAAGSVLESHLDIGRGPVATLLVQRGTLRVGDPMVAGARSEEHTSELQSLMRNSYAVFCLKKKNKDTR